MHWRQMSGCSVCSLILMLLIIRSKALFQRVFEPYLMHIRSSMAAERLFRSLAFRNRCSIRSLVLLLRRPSTGWRPWALLRRNWRNFCIAGSCEPIGENSSRKRNRGKQGEAFRPSLFAIYRGNFRWLKGRNLKILIEVVLLGFFMCCW